MQEIKTELRANLEAIQKRIKIAAKVGHRIIEDIELLPVTKYQPIEKIEALIDLGLSRFGENYAQELLEKEAHFLNHKEKPKWVYIGQLQSNKIQRLVQTADEIQTVASIKHARYIERYSYAAGKTHYPIYIHVNAAAEASKSGVSIESANQLAATIKNECPNLRIMGIMAIPPAEVSRSASIDNIPSLYYKIAETAVTVGEGKLSLGMSADLESAIIVGSTCVRIGTALLGERG
ncbi:MAG: YggS family pyridoxal phosphate-dependent enzyme [Bdellovibrionota bacterium]